MKKLLLLLTLLLCSSAFLSAQDCNGQPALEMNLNSPMSCDGIYSGITVEAMGGTLPYTYIWNTGELTDVIGSLSLDSTYSVTVTDANGCMATDDITMPSVSGFQLELTLNSDIFVSCHGAADAEIYLVAWNATQPVSYLWNTGDTTEDIGDVGPGVYTLVATDANGCVAIISTEIFEPDELELIPTSFPSSGDDGVAAVNVQGGTPPYQYEWNTGDSTQIANGLAPGSYSVTVTDANECTISGTVTVNMFTNTLNLAHLTQFDISPNPSDGQFRVDARFDTYQEFDIFVINTLGQAVTQIRTAGETLTVPIDIRGQNKGVYFVVIQTDKGQTARKFLMR